MIKSLNKNSYSVFLRFIESKKYTILFNSIINKNKCKLSKILILSGFIFLFSNLCLGQTENEKPEKEIKDPVKTIVTTSDKDKGTSSEVVRTNEDEKNLKKSITPDSKPVAKKKEHTRNAAIPKNKKKVISQTVKRSKVKKTGGLNSKYRLLNITEGNFKYKRIPEIELPEKEIEELDEEEIITSDEVIINSDLDTTINTSLNGQEDEGFLGLSKKTIDTIVILIILFAIVGIIIILRIKSKGRGDSVLRRFPGA